MQALFGLIVRNRIAVILLVLVSILAGVAALLRLPVGLFPNLDVPVVNVIAHDPGVSAQDMELLVTQPLEERIRTLSGVQRVASTSISGLATITAQFAPGTRLTDARQFVQAAVSAVQPTLPARVRPQLESIGTTLQEVAGYVIYEPPAGSPTGDTGALGSGGNRVRGAPGSSTHNSALEAPVPSASRGQDARNTDGRPPADHRLIELRRIVQTQIVPQLMAVEGVALVSTLGGDEPAFLVRLRPDALSRLHLTVADVAGALARHNVAVAADFLDRGGQEYPIRGAGLLRTVADIRRVPLPVAGDEPVLLEDVASVSEGPAPRHYTIRGNGIAAVAVTVSKQSSAGTIRVVQDVDGQWTNLTALLPPGTSVHKYYDQAEIIREARNSLFHDLLVGAGLAAIMLFFFMGSVRATLITAASIPIALLVTVAVMQALGQTLNVITLSALTLAVGMVVDDAVVVSESIFRRLSLGEDPQTASVVGAAEIAGPDASGTFTTVAVFAPLLFIGGLAGLFVRPFGLVVSIGLMASLLFSLIFVPMMFAWISWRGRWFPSAVNRVWGPRRPLVPRGRPSLAERQGQEVPKRDESHVGTRDALGTGLLRRIDAGLQRILRFGFAHRWLALVVGAPLLGLGVLAAWLGPVRVLPAVDEGAILIEYIMPPATSLAESDHIGSILEGEALAQPDVQTVYRRTGSPERGLQTEAVNRGELTIKLAPRALRTHTLDQIMNRLRSIYNGIPGVTFLYHQPSQEKMDESLSGLPATFGVTIFGSDPNELIALSAQAEQIMTRDPALTNIINNARFRSPQITVRPDPVELAQYHLEPAALFDVIKAGRCGVPATTILRQSQEIQVLLFLYPEAANSAGPTSRFSPPMTLASLRQLAIPTSSGESIPLERVADIDIAHTPSAITHLNGQREITILAEVSGSVAAVVARLRQSLSAVALPSGDSIAFTGQYEVIRRMVRDFVLTAVLAVTLIYFIMAIEFGSWSQPLLILLTVPIALIGAVVLLAITRVGIDVSVGMGGLTLVGISVNNAIVLLAYANRDTARGLARPAALSSAVSARLRPILMTALTTIIALVPVAVNPAVGSRIFQPFAITVTGGLFSATAATLILLPLLVNRRSTRRSGT